jgi:hypothetical protein
VALHLRRREALEAPRHKVEQLRKAAQVPIGVRDLGVALVGGESKRRASTSTPSWCHRGSLRQLKVCLRSCTLGRRTGRFSQPRRILSRRKAVRSFE